MERLPRARPPLPPYLSVAVRFGVSPAQWPDAVACYEHAYGGIVASEGKSKARRWAMTETAWLFGAFILGAFRPFR
jgi:hypothetical protein